MATILNARPRHTRDTYVNSCVRVAHDLDLACNIKFYYLSATDIGFPYYYKYDNDELSGA